MFRGLFRYQAYCSQMNGRSQICLVFRYGGAEFLILKVLLSIALHNLYILALNIPLFSN